LQAIDSNFIRRGRGKSRITLAWMAGNVPDIRTTEVPFTNIGYRSLVCSVSRLVNLDFLNVFTVICAMQAGCFHKHA
jgi:hypothetical protein